MGFFDSILGLSTSAESIFPHDSSDERAWRSSSGYRDHWGGYSGPSQTGLYIRPDDALNVSCVFLGTRILSEVMGTIPLLFFRVGENNRSIPQPRHPLALLFNPRLGPRPNPWQNSAQWRVTTWAHATLWGLGLSEIEWSQEDGLQLLPIDPEWISDIDEGPNRKSRYKINEPGRIPRILTQDQLFRFEGFGTHSRIPESLLRRSREAVSTWLAQKQFQSSYYLRGAQPSLIAKYTGPPTGLGNKENQERLQQSVESILSGRGNFHKVPLIDGEIDIKEVGHTARNAQVVELEKEQAIELGTRIFGLPAHWFGGENPPYGSREYVMQDLVQLTLSPKGVLFDSAVHTDLIIEPEVFCEHDYDLLTSGSFLEQIQALSIAVMSGLMAENEGRERLGYGSIDGLDEPRRSVNQDRGGDPRGPRQEGGAGSAGASAGGAGSALSEAAERAALLRVLGKEISFDALAQYLASVDRGRSQSPSADDRRSEAGAAGEGREGAGHLKRATHPADLATLRNSARQLLKREIENLREHARKYASSPTQWRGWLDSFYHSHAERVVNALAVDVETAGRYTEGHRTRVLREGVGVIEEWARDEIGVREMVRLAIGENRE